MWLQILEQVGHYLTLAGWFFSVGLLVVLTIITVVEETDDYVTYFFKMVTEPGWKDENTKT